MATSGPCKIALTINDITNGKQISFQAPCSSDNTTGLIINGVEYDIVNAIGDSILGISNMWVRNAIVSVILNTDTKKAYIQNQYDNSPCIIGFRVNQYRIDGVLYTSKDISTGKIIKPDIFDIDYNSNPSKFTRCCDFTDESLDTLSRCPILVSGHLIITLIFTPTDIATIDNVDNSTIYVDIDRGMNGNSCRYYISHDVGVTEYDGKVMALFDINFDSVMMFGDYNAYFPLTIECSDPDIEDLIFEGKGSLSLVVGSEIIMQIL